MGLRETTRQILELVERASGCPVLVTEDPSLKTLAAVRMARGDAPAHVIAYNPATDTQPDYLIAYQCGFILRLFANPPSERWDLAGTAHGRETVHQLLNAADGPARELTLGLRAPTGLTSVTPWKSCWKHRRNELISGLARPF